MMLFETLVQYEPPLQLSFFTCLVEVKVEVNKLWYKSIRILSPKDYKLLDSFFLLQELIDDIFDYLVYLEVGMFNCELVVISFDLLNELGRDKLSKSCIVFREIEKLLA